MSRLSQEIRNVPSVFHQCTNTLFCSAYRLSHAVFCIQGPGWHIFKAWKPKILQVFHHSCIGSILHQWQRTSRVSEDEQINRVLWLSHTGALRLRGVKLLVYGRLAVLRQCCERRSIFPPWRIRRYHQVNLGIIAYANSCIVEPFWFVSPAHEIARMVSVNRAVYRLVAYIFSSSECQSPVNNRPNSH
jgi:hypothetical protein